MSNNMSHLFKDIPTSIISDCLDRLPGCNGLKPMHKGGQLLGVALTVKTRAGDNLYIHKALAEAKTGDIIMVDAEGDISRAVLGEIMMNIAISKGVAGIVIDGAIRDHGAILKGTFPIYAKAANHRGPYKQGPGQLNTPVSVGGWVVNPQDIVVGDEDGVVTFPQSIAKDLHQKCLDKLKQEEETLKAIAEGRYKGTYA